MHAWLGGRQAGRHTQQRVGKTVSPLVSVCVAMLWLVGPHWDLTQACVSTHLYTTTPCKMHTQNTFSPKHHAPAVDPNRSPLLRCCCGCAKLHPARPWQFRALQAAARRRENDQQQPLKSSATADTLMTCSPCLRHVTALLLLLTTTKQPLSQRHCLGITGRRWQRQPLLGEPKLGHP
jgi:hypothetical protein